LYEVFVAEISIVFDEFYEGFFELLPEFDDVSIGWKERAYQNEVLELPSQVEGLR